MEIRSLFLGCPTHDGKVVAQFLCGCIDLERACWDAGVPLQFYFNSGESLVQRARNNVAQVFLGKRLDETNAPATHLLFMDSDLGFSAVDVVRLMDLCDAAHPVVAGLCPLKSIDWGNIAAAAAAGVPPPELAAQGSRNVVDLLDVFRRDGAVVEVKHAGTGFMMIRREALLKFADAYPELAYTPDYKIGDPAFDDAEKITAFFDCFICPDSNRYLSEDYGFCARMRKIGVPIHVCPSVQASHIGVYAYPPNPAGV